MVNKVILMGHVGRDPEIRHLDNNLVVARFSLATTERWTKDNVKTEHTEWHNIVMWRWLAEVAEKYVRKGSLLYIEGKLRSRSYEDKDGNKKYFNEILAEVMKLLDGPGQDKRESATKPVDVPPPIETTEIDSTGDDLPF